jgi:hypothetical protein
MRSAEHHLAVVVDKGHCIDVARTDFNHTLCSVGRLELHHVLTTITCCR